MKKSLLIGLVLVIGIVAAGLWRQGRETPEIQEAPTQQTGNQAEEPSRVTEGIKLVPRTVTFSDGAKAAFRLAEGFDITVAAEGLGKARFMDMSPDGRLFVPDMINWNLSREGRIIILDDWDGQARRFKSQSVYLGNLRGPNSAEFYTDSDGKTWLYITITNELFRYPYSAGDTAPTTKPEIIATFPGKQSPTATGITWHITRTILFENDELYVSVGSGCNSCEQPEDETRAVIWVMDPDGKNARVIADGVRNAVGIAFANGTLFATNNGVDHIGNDKPDDVMYKIEEGKNYGWPYCYESNGRRF